VFAAIGELLAPNPSSTRLGGRSLMAGGGGLSRDLKLIDVYAISTGAMFSSGLFLLPGIAFAQSGSWVILAYFVSALMAVPAMLSKAELSAAMPKAGGTYFFLDRSMGPLVGTVGGLGTWIAMGLKSAFALIGMGAYLAILFDLDITRVAIALTVVFTAINVFGASETARLQRWLVYALVSILAVFVVAGLVDLSSQNLIESTKEKLGSATDATFEGFLATVGLVFISYAGLTKVCGVAEEVENPNRNILLGMALSLGTAALLYTVTAYVLVMVLDHAAMPTDLTPIATAAVTVFDWMPGEVGVWVACTAALAAFASTANAGVMSASRYLLAMGRDDLIGRPFRELGRYRTPTLAVLTTGAFLVVLLLSFDVVSLAKLASAFQLLMFAFVNGAVIVMRESKIEAYDPAVKSPLYPWMQLMGIFFSLALIIELGHMPMLFTLGLIAVGTAWFFVHGKDRVVRRGAVLHWFERLGRERFQDLEAELRSIIDESQLREDDPYSEMIDGAFFIDLDEPTEFPQVSQLAAQLLATRVPLDGSKIAEEFTLASRRGTVPVERETALPHFRVVGLEDHPLVVVRAPAGVKIDVGEEHPSGKREVPAKVLLFLVSPEENPGQHLRILARLASLLEKPEFVQTILDTGDHDDLRLILRGDPVRALTEQLTSKLKSDGQMAWSPGEPGEFANILVVRRGDEDEGIVERAKYLAELSGGRVTEVRLDDGRLDWGVSRVEHKPTGKAWIDVIRAVLRWGHDLVVVAPDDSNHRLDSFTQHLLRKCPCPVWAIRQASRERSSKIAVALAAQLDDVGHCNMDAAVIALAQRLAEVKGAELHVVHAWHFPGEALLEARVSEEDWSGERKKWEGTARRAVADLLKKHGVSTSAVSLHLVEGAPSEVIKSYAEDNEIDMMIMGTAGKAGIAGFFIGSTAEDIVLTVPCAVLAVKPEGFATPIQLPS